MNGDEEGARYCVSRCADWIRCPHSIVGCESKAQQALDYDRLVIVEQNLDELNPVFERCRKASEAVIESDEVSDLTVTLHYTDTLMCLLKISEVAPALYSKHVGETEESISGPYKNDAHYAGRDAFDRDAVISAWLLGAVVIGSIEQQARSERRNLSEQLYD